MGEKEQIQFSHFFIKKRTTLEITTHPSPNYFDEIVDLESDCMAF